MNKSGLVSTALTSWHTDGKRISHMAKKILQLENIPRYRYSLQRSHNVKNKLAEHKGMNRMEMTMEDSPMSN